MREYRRAGPKAKASEYEAPGDTGPSGQAVQLKMSGLSFAEQAQTLRPRMPARAMSSAGDNDTVRLSADPAPASTLAPKRDSARSPSDIAESGFADGGQEVPHRQQMEASFGRSFGNVRAHTDGPARQANEKLGADAYAMDNRIGFKKANPSPALVAHELTHVVQQTEGPATSGTDATGIDTSGEHEAEAVESAVASGQPATTVLGEGQHEASDRQGVSRGTSGRPARKKGDWGLPVTFGADGSLEVAGEFTLWEKPFQWPIVPGVTFDVIPSVKVAVKPKTDGESISYTVGVSGGLAAGCSVGIPSGAELFANVGGAVDAAATYKSQDDGNTLFTAGGDVKAEGKVGVRALGTEFAYKLFEVELVKFTGIEYKNGKRTGSLKLEPGKDLVALLELLKRGLNRIGDLILEGVQITADVIHGTVETSELFATLLSGFGRAVGEGVMSNYTRDNARVDPRNWQTVSDHVFVSGLDIYEAANLASKDVLEFYLATRHKTLTSLGVSKDSIKRLAEAFTDYSNAAEPPTAEDLADMTPLDVADSLFSQGLLTYVKDPQTAYIRFMTGTD